MSTSKFSLQIFLSNIGLAFIIFTIFAVYALIIYRDTAFSTLGGLLILNGFILTLMCLGLSFLISNFANMRTLSAISTVLSLGACFLGGVFVPQYLLSETVKTIGVINPVFWYVKANNTLAEITNYSMSNLSSVFFSMFVQFCFAVAFLAIALVIIKQKRTAEE